MDDVRAAGFILVIVLLMLCAFGIAIALAETLPMTESTSYTFPHRDDNVAGMTITVIPALTPTSTPLTPTHPVEMTFTMPSEPIFAALPTVEPTLSPTFTSSPQPTPQATPASIQQATDLTGQVLGLGSGQAQITLTGLTSTRSQLAMPDGTFAFMQLPPGTYTLRVDHAGYLSFDSMISIGGDRNPVYVEIRLAAGDVNGDSLIDARDLAVIEQFYRLDATQAPPGADMDGDGVIGLVDLNLLAQNLHW